MADEIDLRRAKFPVGSVVRIKPAAVLESLRGNGTLRFPPVENQVAHGGESYAVRRITFSVRGDVLYELENAPGMWHEQLLEKLIKYSPLPPHIRESLNTIEPSRDGQMLYFPCRAVLKSGEACDTVYIAPEEIYIK